MTPAPELDADGLVRLQKLLAQSGVASRRKCEELMLEGHVEVDGDLAGFTQVYDEFSSLRLRHRYELNDLYVATDGLVYVTDRNTGGLYILEMTVEESRDESRVGSYMDETPRLVHRPPLVL